MITSETRAPSTPARSSAALIAVRPSSWAGTVAKAPLKAPTGVRVALTMTMSSFMGNPSGNRVTSHADRAAGSYNVCHKDAAGRRQGARRPHRCHAGTARLCAPHKTVAAPGETAYFDGNPAGVAAR